MRVKVSCLATSTVDLARGTWKDRESEDEQENANAHYERFARRCEERVRKIGDDLNQVVQETIRRLEQMYVSDCELRREQEAQNILRAQSQQCNNTQQASRNEPQTSGGPQNPQPRFQHSSSAPTQMPYAAPAQIQRPYGLQPTKLTIPTFSAAEYEKPIQFLRDFMDYYHAIKALDAAPSEVDMIDKFSRHFDYETQNAIIAQRLRRVDELIEFFDRLDNVGKLNHEKQPERSPFARREPYYTRAPEVTSPNRFLPRPTYPRREEYHRDFRRDNTRNYQSNRPANVPEIDIHETEEEFPHDDVSAESNQQGSGNE
ncbi:unnamed protein product [Trichogramma brassicae]|uniref:Uncharacterized protein n=1 Tax=Trichogramma brassicae TaxID=86971 RepID=A0A6H5IAB2_9HYME|nr:unnamed protein product [Trichogramma brassicae]